MMSSAYEMMFRRKAAAAGLLILVMNVFSGHSLTCRRSEYQIDDECCPMCLPGSRVKTDCTEFRTTSCLPCTEGTFMNQPTGRRQCYPCRKCDAGSGLKMKTSCTTTSDTVCEPLEGFYCMDSTDKEDGCAAAQKHTSCQPGQYISQKGTASSDTVCSDCSAGTFSDCRAHTQCESVNLQLLTPGTVSMDAECGEHSDRRRIVIGVVVGVVGVLVIVILIYLKKKKKGCLNTGGKTNGENSKLEHQGEVWETLNPLQQQQCSEMTSVQAERPAPCYKLNTSSPELLLCTLDHHLTQMLLHRLESAWNKAWESECVAAPGSSFIG